MKFSVVGCISILLGFLTTAVPAAMSQEANAVSTLKVHITYSGSGTADEKHKIYVVLWDTPAFVSGGAMPVEILPLASKDGMVTFSDVKKSPAYVSAAFDPKGDWDAKSGPPPDGSSLGLYSKTPGKPEPIDIQPGKTASIEFSFDDSVKMQSGRPTR
ncbi:MAG: hypothetical protein JO138_12795 [Acidobacteriaceae bacterium]|nr:hypothetical protein [Acidobacteriaceae bacterium]